MANPFDQFDQGAAAPQGNPFDTFDAPVVEPSPPPLMTPEEQEAAPEFNADMIMMADEGFTENLGDRMLFSLGAQTAVDDDEVEQMLSQFPHIETQKTESGTYGINKDTGQQFIINRPGFSGRDVVQGISNLLAFTPAGKAPAIAGGVMGKTATSAAAAGATQAGIETVQEMAGGDYDPWDIAFAAGFGGVAEPIMQGVSAVGRAIAGSNIPKHLKAGLDYAKEQGANITTTDVFQDLMSPAQRIIAKMVERAPITGTGRIKVDQKAERARILDSVAAEYGIDPATDFGETVLNSFNRQRNANIKEATNARRHARETLDPIGTAPTPEALTRVDAQIAKILDLGEEGNQTLLRRLEGIKTELQDGGRNFSRLIKFRTNLYKGGGMDDPFPKETQAALKSIGDGLSADMELFASLNSKVAARQWAKSNQIFRDDLANIKETQLKKLIQKGDINPDISNQILDSNKPALLRQYYNRLDSAGRQATRQRLLQGVLEESGWPQATDGAKVLRNLEKKKTMRAFNAFFPGVHNKQLDGLKEYLRVTNQVEGIGKGVGMAASGGNLGPNAANVITAGLFGVMGRAVESRPVRNLLLRMHYAKGNPKAIERVMSQLRPLAQSIGQGLTGDGGQQPQEMPSGQ